MEAVRVEDVEALDYLVIVQQGRIQAEQSEHGQQGVPPFFVHEPVIIRISRVGKLRREAQSLGRDPGIFWAPPPSAAICTLAGLSWTGGTAVRATTHGPLWCITK